MLSCEFNSQELQLISQVTESPQTVSMFNTSDIFMHEEESTFNLTDISLLSDNSSSQDSSSNYDDSLGSFLYSLDALVSDSIVTRTYPGV